MTVAGDSYPTIVAAAVQASPVFMDRDATVDKACGLIQEAARGGADLVVFPESFIPASPTGRAASACTTPTPACAPSCRCTATP